MTSTLLCPVDEATGLCPESLVYAGEASGVPPDPPPPGPGDPGTTFIPAVPARLGRRLQLGVFEPRSHRPLGEFVTAKVQSCKFQHGPGDATATVATFDPFWEDIAARTTLCRGRTISEPDPKGIEAVIGLDGTRFWPGIFNEPTPASDGLWQLHMAGAEQVWNERALGETEQHDFYEGTGAFPTEFLPGWSWDDNIEVAFNTTDPYEGARSLKVQATGARAGRIHGPWVPLPGQPGQTRYPVASSVVRIDSDSVMQVLCEVENLDGTVIAGDFTIDNRGVSDDSNSDWQIVAGRGRMNPTADVQRVRWTAIVPAGIGFVDIDLMRLQWPTLTGFPSKRDLCYVLQKIAKDAQFGPGGSSIGVPTQILSLCGTEAHLTFAHQDDHPVFECLQTAAEMDGGPDWWFTPGWRMMIAKRRGVDRRDVALTFDNILSGEIRFDAGGEIDEYRALTDLGSRSYRHVHGFSQPVREHRRRIRQITQTPNGMRYDEGRRWAKGQADWAARTPVGAKATVSIDTALEFSVGDGCLFAWADETAGLWGPVRVASMDFDFEADTCDIEVGRDPVVML